MDRQNFENVSGVGATSVCLGKQHNEQGAFDSVPVSEVRALIVHERRLNPFCEGGTDGMVASFNLFTMGEDAFRGLERLAHHRRALDEAFFQADRAVLRSLSREIVMLADLLRLRLLGQVAADVMYCVDGGDPVALAATLSRLMGLISAAIEAASVSAGG